MKRSDHAESATVYWRPGCPYCSRLLGDLERTGLPIRKVDIWEDPRAAATVRSVAGGNETVPTVIVGDRALVNPRASDVVDAVRAEAPELLDGLDADGVAKRASGPWWAGLVVTVAVAAGWFGLAASNPTTTYHFAPAVLAAAWPVGRRLRAGRALPAVTALGTALGGTLIAVATTTLLSARDALVGPTLLGIPDALTETLVAIGLGAAVGALAALTKGRRRPGT